MLLGEAALAEEDGRLALEEDGAEELGAEVEDPELREADEDLLNG